jgi:hypothetical protein
LTVAVSATGVPAGMPLTLSLTAVTSGPAGVRYGVRTTLAAYHSAFRLAGLIVLS